MPIVTTVIYIVCHVISNVCCDYNASFCGPLVVISHQLMAIQRIKRDREEWSHKKGAVSGPHSSIQSNMGVTYRVTCCKTWECCTEWHGNVVKHGNVVQSNMGMGRVDLKRVHWSNTRHTCVLLTSQTLVYYPINQPSRSWRPMFGSIKDRGGWWEELLEDGLIVMTGVE